MCALIHDASHELQCLSVSPVDLAYVYLSLRPPEWQVRPQVCGKVGNLPRPFLCFTLGFVFWFFVFF